MRGGEEGRRRREEEEREIEEEERETKEERRGEGERGRGRAREKEREGEEGRFPCDFRAPWLGDAQKLGYLPAPILFSPDNCLQRKAYVSCSSQVYQMCLGSFLFLSIH